MSKQTQKTPTVIRFSQQNTNDLPWLSTPFEPTPEIKALAIVYWRKE